jgi:hypothetical protein
MSAELSAEEILRKWAKVVPNEKDSRCQSCPEKGDARKSLGINYSCCEECYYSRGMQHSAHCDAREYLRTHPENIATEKTT